MTILHRAEDLISRSLRRAGLDDALRSLHQRHLLVLNYHSVLPDRLARDPRLNTNAVSVSEFSHQMTQVAKLFRPIRPSELRNWQAGLDRAVLVTFDDGYRNNLTYAAPVLQQFGIPALITICPGYIGQKRILWPHEIHWRVLWWPRKLIPMPFRRQEERLPDGLPERLAFASCLRESCKRLPWEQLSEYLARLREYPAPEPVEEVHTFLSWDEVLTLQSYGFEIGSHTMEHPILTQLSRETLISELRNSRSIIEQHIGGECVCFAYPNGGTADFSRAVVKEVRGAGYQFAFTVRGRLAAPEDNPLLLDRIYVPGFISTASFEARISGFQSQLKRFVSDSKRSLQCE